MGLLARPDRLHRHRRRRSSFDDLVEHQRRQVIPCDVVQFRFLGISLAGYNALISLAIVAHAGAAQC